MSQTALPIAHSFDGWIRLPISYNKTPLLTTAIDIDRELWSILEYYSEVEEVGLGLIQSKGLPSPPTHQEIFNCFRSFVRQAKSYYSSAKTLHYRSSSLLYYYSFLNLVKAYLLLTQPQMIMGRTSQAVIHGLSYRTSTTNRDFERERIRVTQGIFPLFYEAQTANAISTARDSSLNIVNLLSYPTELSYQYQLAGYGNPNILSSLAALLLNRVNNCQWAILCIPVASRLNDFLSIHTSFLSVFQEVTIDRNLLIPVFGMVAPDLYPFRFFQDITPTSMVGGRFYPLNQLNKIINALNPYISFHYFDDNKDFDLVLPYTDTVNTTPLPITEALAIYTVMFYLSSLVRYRPDYLEELLNTKPAWLIENFVNSTPETFLRIMVSKIVGIDYIFRRR